MQSTDHEAFERQAEEGRASRGALPERAGRRGEQVMRRSGPGEAERPRNVHQLERVGSVLVGTGLALYALKGFSLRRAPAALLGAALLHRGVTGHCHTYRALGIDTAAKGETDPQPIRVAPSVTINRSADEIFALFRRPETLARMMEGFAELQSTPAGETTWTIRLPLDESLRYTTRVTEERAPELVRFRTSEGSGPQLEGALELARAPGDWGTQVTLRMSLEAPGGGVGRALAKMFDRVPKLFAEKALRRLKSLAETGEVPTLRHNPAARNDGRDH